MKFDLTGLRQQGNRAQKNHTQSSGSVDSEPRDVLEKSSGHSIFRVDELIDA